MTGSTDELQKVGIRRLIGSLLAAILFLSLILSGPAAFSTTPTNPTIIFDGNTLATTTPKNEVVSRPDVGSRALSPAPLSTVVTTARAGYTFGGWSLEKGGEATKELTTESTLNTFAIIYAVWNTTVRYNSNGADSGALTNFKTQDVYRFGQNLTLPTVGTLEKSRFQFAGWMSAPYSPTRITNYVAGSSDGGNPTLYAAWIRTLSFDANGATGAVPASVVYTSGGPRLKLPRFTETTLSKPGYNLAGWSILPTGPIITNPNSFLPLQAQNTLYAIWEVQGTSAAAEIAFKPGKSVLTAAQKRVLDGVASSIGRGTDIKVTVASLRAPGTAKSLGKARNAAVVKYLRLLGIEATVARSNSVATSGTATTPRNNGVALRATWTNPAK
jgi:hypothetical protein